MSGFAKTEIYMENGQKLVWRMSERYWHDLVCYAQMCADGHEPREEELKAIVQHGDGCVMARDGFLQLQWTKINRLYADWKENQVRLKEWEADVKRVQAEKSTNQEELPKL